MDAVVLAGGLGTRLRAVVPDLPKPMAPVAGRPFLAWLLAHLESQGLCDVTLSLGYGADAVRTHFGDRFGALRLHYVVETEPLGTGGAMRAALAGAGPSPVFVLNGDTFVEADYAAMRARHQASSATITMALAHAEDTARYGSVVVESGVVSELREKGGSGPGWINAGLYLVEPRLLDDPALPDAFSFERDILEARLAALRPVAFECRGFFIDIGVPDEYERAQQALPRRLAHLIAHDPGRPRADRPS